MGTYKINPVDLEVGNIVKGYGEVVAYLGTNKNYTVVEICNEKGELKYIPFRNEKEVEVIS